jgi:hypothetical protein
MFADFTQEEIDSDWRRIKGFFQDKFTDGERATVETMLFLIGVQELGKIKTEFSKEDKIDLMHMATCKLLEPFGYFTLEKVDEDGWKHYKQQKHVAELKKMEQFEFFQIAMIRYFRENIWTK